MLNSTEQGAPFRHFCVSNVITTAHAHKSSVIFHFFPRAFKQKKKIRLYDQRWLKLPQGGGGSCLNLIPFFDGKHDGAAVYSTTCFQFFDHLSRYKGCELFFCNRRCEQIAKFSATMVTLWELQNEECKFWARKSVNSLPISERHWWHHFRLSLSASLSLSISLTECTKSTKRTIYQALPRLVLFTRDGTGYSGTRATCEFVGYSGHGS